ncbi:MAG: glycosyltransferase family 39 protein [Planctomycetes bacterium]|nr:glycosyltransferase family 39 protein [Planctomycetota bacterium]
MRLPFVVDPGITGDEANMVSIARCSTWEIVSGVALDDSNPPLFMVLLRGLLVTFGERVWVWKLASTAVNLAFLAVMMGLFRRWLGSGIALMAGALGAIHPWQVYMATEVRGYAVAALFAVWAISAAERFAATGRTRFACAWAIACAAGFWTHYSVAVIALVTGVFTLIQIRSRPGWLAAWCGFGVAAVALMALWFPRLAEQNVRHGGGVTHLLHLAGLPVVHAAGTTFLRPGLATTTQAAGSLAVLIVFALPACVGAVYLWRRQRSLAMLVLTLLTASVMVPLIRSALIGSFSFSSRYTFVVHLATLLLVSCGLLSVTGGRRTAGLVAIVLLSALSLGQFRFVYVGRSAWQSIVTVALETVGPNDALIVPSAMQAMRLRHFSNGRFENLFVASSGQQHPAYVPPGASWVDLYNGRRNPGEFFTETAAGRLGEFTTVWCLPEQSVNDRPAGLGPHYSLKETVLLLPGGQFGAEVPAYLGQWIRTPNNSWPSRSFKDSPSPTGSSLPSGSV